MIKKCTECSATLKPVVLSQYERRSAKTGLVIFEDVPAHECPRCGEQYFEARVSELMESVLQGKLKPTGLAQVSTSSLKSPAA